MEKKDVWKRIKGLDISIPFQEKIFGLIDENLDRIQFVQDHIGLRDFLFIAEVETNYHDELFLFLDADVTKEGTLEENERKIMEKYDAHPFDILSKLKGFFETEKRILTIGIGFKNTEPTDEEIEEIENANLGSTADSKIESYRDLRIKKFPMWYSENAKMPKDVTSLMTNEEEQIAFLQRQAVKDILIASINKALEEGDEEAFLKYSNQLKVIYV